MRLKLVSNWSYHKGERTATYLDVLLQVLRTLETLAAEVALVGLEGHMDSDVRRNVVTLHRGGAAEIPAASQIQVVCALAANMTLANMFL